jgi:hypothetical protein
VSTAQAIERVSAATPTTLACRRQWDWLVLETRHRTASLGGMRIPDPYPDTWHDGQPHECHITASEVLLDGVPVPGTIAEAGVSVEGGGKRPNGELELNTVTITLMVGAVEIDDEVIQNVEVHLQRRQPEH